MDRLEVKFEVTDHFLEGATEVTKIEKFTSAADGQLVELVDLFAKFLNIYGFRDELIATSFAEWLNEYEDEK